MPVAGMLHAGHALVGATKRRRRALESGTRATVWKETHGLQMRCETLIIRWRRAGAAKLLPYSTDTEEQLTVGGL